MDREWNNIKAIGGFVSSSGGIELPLCEREKETRFLHLFRWLFGRESANEDKQRDSLIFSSSSVRHSPAPLSLSRRDKSIFFLLKISTYFIRECFFFYNFF